MRVFSRSRLRVTRSLHLRLGCGRRGGGRGGGSDRGGRSGRSSRRVQGRVRVPRSYGLGGCRCHRTCTVSNDRAGRSAGTVIDVVELTGAEEVDCGIDGFLVMGGGCSDGAGDGRGEEGDEDECGAHWRGWGLIFLLVGRLERKDISGWCPIFMRG